MSYRFHRWFLVAAVIALVGCDRGDEPVVDQGAAPPSEPQVEATTAPKRHVDLAGQSNFRDLGGYQTTDGQTVKWGEVYRSGELPHLTDEDVARLEELEIRTVVNFLLPEEIEQNGQDRLPDETREVSQSISGDRAAELTMVVQSAIKAAEFDQLPPEINPEFHRLLLDEGKEQYAALLREMADPANRPLAFHCSHGVHRTGTATAILLSALGVPWDTVREDYLLTNEYRREEVEATLAKIRQMAGQKMRIPPDEVDMTNVEAFYILQGSYIDGALEAAIEDYGSTEAYIREGLGLEDEEIERLRKELLE